MLSKLKLGLGLAVVGGSFLWRVYRRRKPMRAIQDLPCAKTETAPQGLVELQGFAWSYQEAPKNYRGHEIIYYQLQLQRYEKRGSGKNSRHEWVTCFQGGYYEHFLLVDPTGLALIDTRVAKGNVINSVTRSWSSLPSTEQAFLIETYIGDAVSGFPPSDFLFGLFSHKYRIIESEICEGSPIHVIGDFRTSPASNLKIRRRGLTKFADKFFLKSARSLRNVNSLLDQNKDGKISYQELSKGYTQYARFCRTQSAEDLSDEVEFSVHGEVGASTEHGLLIADSHQEQLLEHLGSGTLIQMIVGVLLVTAALAVIFIPWHP